MDTNIGYIISKIAYGIIPVVYKEENELDKQRMKKKIISIKQYTIVNQYINCIKQHVLKANYVV